ncbi:MAG: aminotransferase class V-fold PLP-dependent enzyme [Clostridia bacterium]|nr:aminotransferase class V-fold PLP-dependent enzyme [Clostridia bacterium]
MKLIYFDNSATIHYKPRCVMKSFLKAISHSANSGRSGHKLSTENAIMIWRTREFIAKEMGDIEPENVIFTKNCTEGLNLVLKGLPYTKRNVIYSCFEHNSVVRVLHELEKEGKIDLTVVYPQNKNYITASDVKKVLEDDTYLVCVNSLSNVSGNKNDIESIGNLCHKNEVLFLCDHAQGAGHIKVDMKKSNIDYLCFSGQKGFFTPQGIGCLCINSGVFPKPLMFGGTGTESDNLFQPKNSPECYESGTLPAPLIASLKSGVEYVSKDFESIEKKTKELTKFLYDELSNFEEIKIYTAEESGYGVLSFNIEDVPSTEVCDFLDKKYNIATRGGLHCAPLAHKFFGTLESGMVRVSLCHKNTFRELNVFVDAIRDFIDKKEI